MTAGFGVDKGADGSGTSSSDIRKIFGGLYTPGIISGCTVTTSATIMSYTVNAGVVAISSATGEIILAPVATTAISTPAAPGTGTRTDTVYVQQRFPSIEGDANLIVGVTSGALPARAVALNRYIISAGQTKTSSAVATGGIDYSIPYGASLGRLHYYQHTNNGVLPTDITRIGNGTFNLPTDRRVRFSMRATMNAMGASGFDNAKYCEWAFLPSVDGNDFLIWSTPGLHQAWQTVLFDGSIDLSAGVHTVNLAMKRLIGPGVAESHYGIDSNGWIRNGIEFFVEDVGPAN